MWKITVNFSVLQSPAGFAEMCTYVEKIFLKINIAF
jgi:UDP-N-acetyl-D-mannosaminuronate dehydrogenase